MSTSINPYLNICKKLSNPRMTSGRIDDQSDIQRKRGSYKPPNQTSVYTHTHTYIFIYIRTFGYV